MERSIREKLDRHQSAQREELKQLCLTMQAAGSKPSSTAMSSRKHQLQHVLDAPLQIAGKAIAVSSKTLDSFDVRVFALSFHMIV